MATGFRKSNATFGGIEHTPMINVLYYNHTAVVSGAEISLLGLLNHLDRSRFSPIIACPKGEFQKKALSLHISTKSLSPFEFGSNVQLASIHLFTQLYQITKELTTIIHENNIDLVHANSVRAGLLACLATSFHSIPVIVHVRDCVPFSLMGRLTREIIGKYSKKIICNSGYGRKHFACNMNMLKQSIVVYNAVDLMQFDSQKVDSSEVKAELGLWDCYPILAIVGQITPCKGQIDAINAIPTVLKIFPSAKLLIVGSVKFKGAGTRYDNSTYEKMLHSATKRLGLNSQVIFTGERGDIPAIMKAIDVLVFASWGEPFGRVLIEAMAMEKPAIATNGGGSKEILENGVTGMLIPPRNEAALAEAIIQVCSNHVLQAEMARHGRARVERLFGIKQHVKQVERIYESVAGM